MNHSKEISVFLQEVKRKLVIQNILASIFLIPLLIALIGAGVFLILVVLNDEASVAYLSLALIPLVLGFLLLKQLWRIYKLPLVEILENNPEKIVWVFIRGITATAQVEIIPILKLTNYYIVLGDDSGQLYNIRYSKNNILEKYEMIEKLLNKSRFGDTNINKLWYQEKYMNRWQKMMYG